MITYLKNNKSPLGNRPLVFKKMMLLFSLCLMLSLLGCKEEESGVITVVSTEEMQTLLDLEDVQLVDVRTANEHKAGHLSDSQNIDFNSPTFIEDIDQLDKEKPVILYCQRGSRSAKCAKKMQEAGFKKIYDLQGGFSKWEHEEVSFKLKS